MTAEPILEKVTKTGGVHDAGLQLAESIGAVLPRGKHATKPRKGQAERILARARPAPHDLRHIGETAWKDLFESVSLVDRVLQRDPAQTYSRMDFATRDRYRSAIAEMAKHSARTEIEVAEAAVELAGAGTTAGSTDRAAIR